ncbi:MAG: hypothetical protein MUC36_10345 [Planctomycetes bacterium]|jgi:hypothetical protein|nr:hypothetical protein [Planctomycetota bacterium]
MLIQSLLSEYGGTIKLPHQDIPIYAKKLVVEACELAWSRLKAALQGAGSAIEDLDEDAITTRLKELLNLMLREVPSPVPGFDCAMFETVVRDAKVMDYEERSVDKMPDLVFRLVDATPGIAFSEYRGFFAECKIVENGARNAKLYCCKGVSRFVEGQYAWAMPSALMIGYARNGLAVDPHLRKELAQGQVQSPDPYATTALPNQAHGIAASAHRTAHSRGWAYKLGGQPGEIEIVHVWLA